MSGPARICPIPSTATLVPATASAESILPYERLFCDANQPEAPDHWAREWDDPAVRTSEANQQLYLIIHSLRQVLSNPENPLSESQRLRLEQWVEGARSDTARPLDQATLHNLQRIFAGLPDTTPESLRTIRDRVGEPPPPPVESSEATGEAESTSESSGREGISLRSVGVDLQNDSLLADVILRNIGIPIDAFVTEQAHLTLRVPFEWNLGDYVGTIRPFGGIFSSRGIPGSGGGEAGLGWRAGVDVGITVPQDVNHQSAGLGLEVTGVLQAAEGESTPDPALRLHFYRQRDLINFALGDARQFEVGLQTFLNTQETYLPLTNESLLPEASRTPFSQTQSVFATSPFRLLGLSLRYYPDGVPQTPQSSDPTRPFAEGEAAPRIAALAVGNLINRNRRRGIPTFANSRVFLGLEPLGTPGSRDQFDTVGLGLTVFSALDGFGMAATAQDRSEILRRGNWIERGVMLALDGLDLVVDLGLTLGSAGDPTATTIEALRAEPGSLTDFEGRAGQMDLWLRLVEYALTGIDATQALGEDWQQGSLAYGLMGGGAILLGLPLFFFSAPMSGSDCAPEGGLLYCGFGATGPFFREEPHAGGPDDIRQVERQFIVSSAGMAMTAWGVSRLLGLIFGGGGNAESEASSEPDADEAAESMATEPAATPPVSFQLEASPQEVRIGVSGRF